MLTSDRLVQFPVAAREVGAPQWRTLLVGNDRVALKEMARSLAQHDLAAVTAIGAAAALDQVERGSGIEVVVTDLVLDGLSGLELLRKLGGTDRSRHVRTIVIAEQASVDHVLIALRLGAFDFLLQPVSALEVAEAVGRALAGGVDSPRPRELSRQDAAQLLLNARRKRDAIFGADLFEDPAWNIMLDLYWSALRGRPVVVTDLCIASGAPATTALRRLGVLASLGLIERQPDPDDRRRVLVVQTDRGRAAMDQFAEWLRDNVDERRRA